MEKRGRPKNPEKMAPVSSYIKWPIYIKIVKRAKKEGGSISRCIAGILEKEVNSLEKED